MKTNRNTLSLVRNISSSVLLIATSLVQAQTSQSSDPADGAKIERAFRNAGEMTVVSETEIGSADGRAGFFSFSKASSVVYVSAVEAFKYSAPSDRRFGARFNIFLIEKDGRLAEKYDAWVDHDEISAMQLMMESVRKIDPKIASFPEIRAFLTMKNGIRFGVYRPEGGKKLKFYLSHADSRRHNSEVDADEFFELLKSVRSELDKAAANKR